MNPFEFVNTFIFGPAIPIILIAAGLFYGFKLNYFYIFDIRLIIKSMLGKLNTGTGGKSGDASPDQSRDKPRDKSGMSPYQAVTVALAGTLGVGNIVGVATAITLGGAGAIFWMWISALAAMVLKYGEIVLAVKYRREETVRGKHRYFGGAMYYISEIFGGGRGALIISAVFAVFCIVNSFTLGGFIQINAVSEIMYGVLGVQPFVTGIVMALLTMLVICANVKNISWLTEKLVPLISAVYVFMSVYVIIVNLSAMPGVFARIFGEALSPASAAGGAGGFLLSRAMRYGTMRGLFSNEAGCGTAPIAHAESNAEHPSQQGFWGIFEVFVDTIVLCSLTALVVIPRMDALAAEGLEGIMLVVRAFAFYMGGSAGYIMCAAVFFFAYATVICWAHYGMECVSYLSREGWAGSVYLGVFCVVILLGSLLSTGFVWQAADFSIGVMTLINTAAICMGSGEVKRLTAEYMGRLRAARDRMLVKK